MDDLTNNLPCGVFIFDDRGIITDINDTFGALLKYERNELIGRRIDMLLNIAGRIFYQTHFFPLIKLHNKAEEIFFPMLSKENEEIPLLVNAFRRQISTAWHNVCAAIPVYQRKEFERQLILARQQAEESLRTNEALQRINNELERHKEELELKMGLLTSARDDIAQFSRVIAHDIQEPVRKAAIFSDIIKQSSLPLSVEGEKAHSQIYASLQKLQHLIVSLHQYISITILRPDNVEECDLLILVSEALQQLHSEGMPPISVSCDHLPKVKGNRDQLRLMFYHLLKNAIKFNSSPKPSVTIEGEIIQQNRYKHITDRYRYIDMARIKICDNGPGFGMEYKDYIFGLFKKIDPDTADAGVGLSLCKKIVENHLGTITAGPEKKGGACFTLYLPIEWFGIS